MRTPILLIALLTLAVVSCKKNDPDTQDIRSLPQSPVSLFAMKINPGVVRLTWEDKSDNENGFKIERKTGSGAFTELVSVEKNIVEFTDRNIPLDTNYTYRVYAYNAAGRSFSFSNEANADSYTPKIPYVETSLANNIKGKQASLNAFVGANYTSPVIWFEYGETIAYGQVRFSSFSYLTGGRVFQINDIISGLKGKTTYHYRVVAENDLGIARGKDWTFTTLGDLPFVQSLDPSDITATSVKMNGKVYPNFLDTKVFVEFGSTTAYGSEIPTGDAYADNDTVYTSIPRISLMPNTQYHFRLKAVNELGVTYGIDKVFKTKEQ
jgi:hypothetical protein